MNVIVIGAGITGSELTRSLIAKKHNVVLIERDEETARHAANRLDCRVINDAGNNTEVLKDAGIEKADALVTVTDSDEINLITCGIVDSVAPQVFKIARVRNDDYLYRFKTSKERVLGVDAFVFPDEEAAINIIRTLEHGAVSDIMAFQGSSYELVRFPVEADSILVGVRVASLHDYVDCKFIVVALEDGGKNVIPSGNTVLNSDAKITILTAPENINKFYKLAGFKVKPLKKIAIVGMGRIGYILAEYFFRDSSLNFIKKLALGKKIAKNIIIIEKNEAIAKDSAAKFPDATVYHADIMNEAFIEEANLSDCDLVITATQNFELNMVASALLKAFGVSKNITLVQSSVMESIAYKLGIDVAVSYKGSVVDAITSHLSGEHVKAVHTMGDGDLEVIELLVSEESTMIGKPLKQFSEHGNFLILLIERGYENIIPGGDNSIEAGDKVVFITTAVNSPRINAMISGTK